MSGYCPLSIATIFHIVGKNCVYAYVRVCAVITFHICTTYIYIYIYIVYIDTLVPPCTYIQNGVAIYENLKKGRRQQVLSGGEYAYYCMPFLGIQRV